MKKVQIISISTSDKYNCYTGEAVEIYVDGELIAYETYGGEPEDNSRVRDYKWVEPLLKKLSEKLGARAEIIALERDD